MLATMLIQAAPAQRIVVPAEAVVRENNADHVFVEIAPRTFRLTPVRLGPESGGQRPVLDGLKAGERIVADGLNKIQPGQPVTPLAAGAREAMAAPQTGARAARPGA